MRAMSVGFCTIVLLFGLFSSSHALQRQISFERLCKKSERIVIGTVKKIAYEDGEWIGVGRLPFTEVTLEVDRVWKGERSEQIVVHVPGGQRPSGSRVHVSEMPRFKVGEKVLVFTYAHNGQEWVYGCQQGKYRVVVSRVVGKKRYPIQEDVLLFALEHRVRSVLASSPDRKGG